MQEIDYGGCEKNKTAEQSHMLSVNNYADMISQKEMITFYRLIYSQRAVDPAAARILREETQRMILSTKNMFYALQVHGKLNVRDVDAAALSFAMTIHSIIDYLTDCTVCGEASSREMLTNYIKWFCCEFGGDYNE